ncbi:MAG: hypothetical protein ACRD1T_21275, partial [Acidimicrobiia bacterium]
FLTFVVAKKLLSHDDQIKETTIAIRVFGESADFDPMESSKVRVAGSDLRWRLSTYYAGEGRNDPVELQIPLSTYVPAIHDRGLYVEVGPLENWHPSGKQAHICATIGEELAYQLDRDCRVRVTRVGNRSRRSHAPRYRVRGSVEHGGEDLRLNISLADLAADGIILSRSFRGRRERMIELTRSVADVVLNVLTGQRVAQSIRKATQYPQRRDT